MNKPDETLDGNGVSITDVEIRRSLLGCASASEQTRFETQLMVDDQLEQRVQRMELELADDFSFGRLNAAEQELFSNRFLVSTKRARDLAVSRALRKAIAVDQPQQLKAGWRSRLPDFALQRPIASAAIAAMALIFFGFLSWVVLKTPTVRRPAIAKQPPIVDPGIEYAHPVSPAPDQGSTLLRIVASLTLAPDSGAAIKPTLHWTTPTAEQDRLRLELLVDRDTSGTYQAFVMTDKGSQITAFYDLKPEAGGQTKVVLTLPPPLLPAGSYYIDLTRSSAGTTVGTTRYSFQTKAE